MARKKTARERLDAALLKHTAEIQAAFNEAVETIRDEARINEIVAALEAGNINRAVSLVGADAAAFYPLAPAISSAYQAGGILENQSFPQIRDSEGARLLIRFDPGNPRAEAWLRDHSASLIEYIVDDQRVAIRDALAQGMSRGQNPRVVALDVVGRVNRVTGKREGGIVGLTAEQARYVDNGNPDFPPGAYQQLTSGEPDDLRAYLGRQARDRRYDKAVLRAIQDEKPLDRDLVQRMTMAYKDSLLKVRGDAIARSEAKSSLFAGRMEATRQMMEDTGFTEDDIEKAWKAIKGDGRTRDSHLHMDGERVAFNRKFSNGLEYPGDQRGRIEEWIQCRCDMQIKIRPRVAA
jgi:hypothetical protein